MLTCRKLIVFLLLLSSPIFSEVASDADAVKIIQAHLRLRDYLAAKDQAIQYLHQFPSSKSLWIVYINVLGKSGQESEMLSTWKEYVDAFPEEKNNRHLTESISWSVLEHAMESPSPVIRIMATLSGFLSQDSRGIEILLKSLNDSSSIIRSIAVELSSHLGDDSIKEAIYKIFRQESVFKVRLEAIKALGALKVKTAKNELFDILQNSSVTKEETESAVQAITLLLDDISRPDIAGLIKSDRAGLRLLACEVVDHFNKTDDVDLLLPLIEDHNRDVRKSALNTLGNLRIKTVLNKTIEQIALEKVNDIDPEVGIKAAWLMTLNNPQKGQSLFYPFLIQNDRDMQIVAAAHLAACGKYAQPLIVDYFKKSQDPLIKMNLSFGMIGQNLLREDAFKSLYEGLNRIEDKLVFEDFHHIRMLTINKSRRSDNSNYTKEEQDQITRLDILNTLCMMKYPEAENAVLAFLKEKKWGLTAMAATTLLVEGDASTVVIVEKLMDHPDMHVRVQAALVLAMWGSRETPLNVLFSSYDNADREMKEHILEGIAKIADPESIPFLLERLQESNQSLRVIAAAGLILCLYH